MRSASQRLQAAGANASELGSALREVTQALTLAPDNADASSLKAALEDAIAAAREAAPRPDCRRKRSTTVREREAPGGDSPARGGSAIVTPGDRRGVARTARRASGDRGPTPGRTRTDRAPTPRRGAHRRKRERRCSSSGPKTQRSHCSLTVARSIRKCQNWRSSRKRSGWKGPRPSETPTWPKFWPTWTTSWHVANGRQPATS